MPIATFIAQLHARLIFEVHATLYVYDFSIFGHQAARELTLDHHWLRIGKAKVEGHIWTLGSEQAQGQPFILFTHRQCCLYVRKLV